MTLYFIFYFNQSFLRMFFLLVGEADLHVFKDLVFLL